MILVTTNRDAHINLWPVAVPRADGRLDEWSKSAREAARLAETEWVAIVSNTARGAYDIRRGRGTIPDPEWPHDLSFAELVRTAFKDRLIDSLEHPIIREIDHW